MTKTVNKIQNYTVIFELELDGGYQAFYPTLKAKTNLKNNRSQNHFIDIGN